MHVDDAELMAFRDGEGDDRESERIKAHLGSCAACRARLEALSENLAEVRQFLAALTSGFEPPAAAGGRVLLQKRLELDRGRRNMWKDAFAGRYRPVWVSLAVAIFLAALIAIPPVRALASRFLYLFRAQKIQTIQIDAEQIGGELRRLKSSSGLERLLGSSLRVEHRGETEEVASASLAGEKAGLLVRAPKALTGPVRWLVKPATTIDLELDLGRIRGVLDEIGRQDIGLPPNIDGASIHVDVPPCVVGFFGECGSTEGKSDPDDEERRVRYRSDCVVLTQLPSPTVVAPDGIDIHEVATAMLQFLGLSREEAEEFGRNVDWTATLVVPIPKNMASEESLVVDGVRATLLTPAREGPKAFLLLWIKDEMIYALSGSGDREKALSIAQSLP